MERLKSIPAKVPPPPEAPYWPSGRLLGHIEALGADPLNTLTRAHRDMGDLARIRLGVIPGFLVYNPADIKRVLVTESDTFTKTTRGYHKLRLMLGNGLVTSEGNFWLRQRRIAQPAFCRSNLAGFSRSMVSATEEQVAAWDQSVEPGDVVDMAEAMSALTLRIAGDTLVSVDVRSEARVIGEALDVAMSHFNHLVSSPLPYPEYWPTPANFRFWSMMKKMRTLVGNIIRERRESGRDVPDLLGMFMAAEDADTGERMTDEQLCDEMITMLTAGHETTANALAWTLQLISRHPDVRRRLEAEVDGVLGGRRVSHDDLSALTYTRQVIKEAMRLYPPVWMVARQAAHETELGGFRIPKGSYVFMSQWAIHRHPEYWTNPEAFDPDRFAPDRPDPDRFIYMPFSRGKRQCIGDRFAEMESMLIVVTLAQHYRFALEPGYPVVPEASVTLRPRDGLKMRLVRRQPIQAELNKPEPSGPRDSGGCPFHMGGERVLAE